MCLISSRTTWILTLLLYPFLLTVISLFHPLFPVISLNIFFYFLCLCARHLFGGLPLPLPLQSAYSRERQEAWRKNDMPWFRTVCPYLTQTGGYTLMHTDCLHRQCLCYMTTNAFPETEYCKKKKHEPSEQDVTSNTVTGSLENFMVALTTNVVIWSVSTSPWSLD